MVSFCWSLFGILEPKKICPAFEVPPSTSPVLSARNGNVILPRTWQALEHSGEAKEWVRGVDEDDDREKDWVELMERIRNGG